MRPPSRPPQRHRGVAAVLSLTLIWAGAAPGQTYRDTPFKPDAEPDAPKSIKPGRKWEEAAFTLPAWPSDKDLVEVKLDGPQRSLTHYIDTRSLGTGEDGVVRYTLVTESASGARNLSFEGLRCTPKGRWKTYAYGMDGRFKATSVADDWREIRDPNSDPLHYDLWRHYLCVPRGFEARPRRDQVRMLKSGRVPRVESSGFLTD